jgi:hypothetical protein
MPLLYLPKPAMENSGLAVSTGNVPFIAPPKPPEDPIIPDNATGAMINELRLQHTKAIHRFRTYNAVDAALKAQLLEATNSIYICSLEDGDNGWAKVRTRTLIEHLYENYGTFNAVATKQNLDKIQAPWDPRMPIEILFQQIDTGAAIAKAGKNPLTEALILHYAYINVEATQVMETACLNWRMKEPDEKTWVNFKTHFKKAHNDMQSQRTTSDANYHVNQVAMNPYYHVNQAIMHPHYQMNQYGGNFPCLANYSMAPNHGLGYPGPYYNDSQNGLASNPGPYYNDNQNGLASNNGVVPQPAPTGPDTAQLVSVLADLKNQDSVIAELKNQVKTLSETQTDILGKFRKRTRPAPTAYCWTHGGCTHASKDCRKKGDGHKDAATKNNRLGGSNSHCTGN